MRSNAKTLYVSVLLAGALLACAATPRHESTGAYLDDASVTSKVKADLIKDPLTKARDISGTAVRGVVQLSGFVASRDQRAEAERVAKAIPGVLSVDNALQLQTLQ